MSALLWAGTVVGATCGLAHGVYVYNRVSWEAPMTAPGGPNRPKALSYAIWTVLLWVLSPVSEPVQAALPGTGHAGQACLWPAWRQGRWTEG
jgi:hypothetical protein